MGTNSPVALYDDSSLDDVQTQLDFIELRSKERLKEISQEFIAADGVGFDLENVVTGFGSIIVQALISGEFKDTVDLESDSRTRYKIVWKK